MLKAFLRSLRTGVVTVSYPDTFPAQPPERFRGAPRIRLGSAFEELPPASVCPSGAITGGAGQPRYSMDLAQCLFCGRCAENSGHGQAYSAIELGRQVELASRSRERLVVQVERAADGQAATLPALQQRVPPQGLGPNASQQALVQASAISEQIRRTLGRSLALRHLDSGSCNACDWELTALLNPVYDVRRLGIDFVASPRHADGVIVTGPVTRNLEPAVRRTWEAVPEPRVVIAVGACASSGGIVGAGYASAGGVDQVLPVDVFIPGCPPRPEAIIFGILLAVGRIEQRRR